MEDGISAGERVSDAFGDVGDEQLGAGGNVVARARAEVVHHDDVVAARDESLGDVAADEPRAAGEDDAAQADAWAGTSDSSTSTISPAETAGVNARS